MPPTSPWDETLRLLAARQVTGLLHVAVRDALVPDAPAGRVGDVYLELDHGYLQLESVNSHGGLLVRYLEAIDLQPFREVFEQDDVFLVRLDSLFFGEAETIECLEVNYVTNEESDLEKGIVRCVEFVFSYGVRIFFDPMYTSGVRVGNTDGWTRSWEEGPWVFQRHTWTRP